MTNLITFLKARLQQPLPGAEAQAKMMPSLSDRSRFKPEARENARPGGVMLLLYPHEGEWYFPLIQRPDYDGVHAKQMSFPGGKMDKTDQDLFETAIRETEEEIGVTREKFEVLGAISELYIIASNFNVLPVVGVCSAKPSFTPDYHEVDTIEEIKLEDLMNEDMAAEKPLKIAQGITISAPYFDLNGKMVWGATAMMLAEFKEILKPYFSDRVDF